MNVFERLFRRRRGTGWRPNKPDERDHKYRAMRSDVPDAESLRDLFDIVDQGGTSSCVGNAIAGAINVAEKRSGHVYEYPSRMFVYWNGRARYEKPPLEDDGAYIREAFKAVRKLGVCDESDWPFKSRKVNAQPGWDTYSKADPRKDGEYLAISSSGSKRIEHVKNAISDGHVVVFGTNLAKSFYNVRKGDIVDRPSLSDKIIGGHAMAIVGYKTMPSGETRFEIANSWGTWWGDRGFCWMTERYITWSQTGDLTITRGWRRLVS